MTGQPHPLNNMITTKIPPTRNSNHSTVPSSSKVSRTTSAGPSNAQAPLVGTADEDHVTPRAMPAPQHPSKSGGEDVLATIKELVKNNGCLPEEAVDDDSGSDSSCVVPQRHTRPFLFTAGNDQLAVSSGLFTCPPETAAKKHPKYPPGHHDHLPAVPETATISQFNGQGHSRNHVPRRTNIKNSKSCQSSSSSDSSQNHHHSSALTSGYKHLTGGHVDNDSKPASDRSPASKTSSRQRNALSASARSSPLRKAQSASDIMLSQETIDAARKARTIDNYHTKTTSFMRPEDFYPLPPQPPADTTGQQLPIYTQGPNPGLPVHTIPRRSQARPRRPVPPPALHARAPKVTARATKVTARAAKATARATKVMARAPKVTGNQNAIITATSAITRSMPH